MRTFEPLLSCFFLCFSLSLGTIYTKKDSQSDAVHGVIKNYLDKQLRVFTGIPYAQPPKGKLRFLKPQPLRPSGNLRLANHAAPSCMQSTPQITDSVPQQEPVNANQSSLTSRLPDVNSSSVPTGRGVLSAYGDIVVVSFNYRLGAFGFLQLNSKVSGNMGLYDQVRALEWVQHNVEYFGGDPQRVTVMGHEAGAVSLGMLLLSPLCKGLLQQAVLLSGAPNWLVDPMDNEDSVMKARKLARAAGCHSRSRHPGREAQQLGQCLLKVDAARLVKAEAQVLNGSYYSFMPRQRDMIIPMDPVVAVAKGHVLPVDVLVGFTENEGFMQAYKLFPTLFNFERPVNLSLQDAEDILMQAVELFPATAKDYMKEMYFGRLSTSSSPDDIRDGLAQAFGDIFVTCPARIFAESYGDRPMNAFLYKFTHRPLFSTNPPSARVTSFDDVPYIFGEPLRYPERFSLEDISITKMMMNLITSFVKTGNPEPVKDYIVPKFESPDLRYVDLGSGGVVERKYPSRRCDFWKKFYPKNT
ncbi:acetylcholinesterase-1-like isoform X2 [Varroa jacobsoni]|uniref:Carboxylesterase type B domain-containing protein n=1 Tax=Varroa destructor TaxID=109461 RepID=A0A7M7ME44_VARDE|nr:acetylcholinesterase-1-like isoform X2 [Varroa destructor]XP_022702732.1 acetylcholinesterase-1-like isoform X2 [Varroa jacobsoni]